MPDERLEPVARAAGASPVVAETVEFHDIAGLVRGASEGEGLGNRFLAAIRETDAICHVVRAHGDEGVPHPEGAVDPPRDAEIVEAELRQADLETAAARLEPRRQAGELRRQGGGRGARLARGGGRGARAATSPRAPSPHPTRPRTPCATSRR